MHTARHTAALLTAALITAAGAGYVLRARGDGLIAYCLPEYACVFRSDFPVSALRRIDREMLEKGLYFGTFPELTRALEDFGS